MSRLKIAIQKSGRLNEDSLNLLKDCGIKIENGRDQLRVVVGNFPIDLYYLRNSDIPQYLEDGIVDVGMVGENLLIEQEKKVDTIRPLGFSKCRVSLAVPKESNIKQLVDLEGKKVATSYPNTLRKFLREQGIGADIHTISGSVEIAPNIGLADAIFDIVSTGSTLFKNGLKEFYTVMKSEAVLVASPKISAEAKAILEKLLFRIETVNRAKESKYVLMNVPNDCIEKVSNILPVLKSPTILPLAEKGWSSLHSVINENEFWEVLDQLKDAGARDILVVPISKMAAL